MKILRKKYIDHINHWWQSNGRDALFVLGTIGVGKTSLIVDWAEENRVSHTYFPPETYQKIKEIFEDSKSKSFDTSLAIINALMMTKPLGELLIFDGIEPNDEILVQVKKLCSASKHRYILISDYGEFVFHDIRFLPVGSINRLTVRPLSFREYCSLKLSKYIIGSMDTVLTEPNIKYPFADQFEEAWMEYSNYGGFPGVVSALLERGMPFADAELIKTKREIQAFVEEKIPFSGNLSLILDNFGNTRSKTYHRFVFSLISQTGTYQRFKRATKILEQLGIVGVLPLEGASLNFEYCDLYLCDPGLERIWGGELGRYHAVESVLYSFGLRKNYRVRRLVLGKDKIIDLTYDTVVPWLIDVKLRNTNSINLSALKFKSVVDRSNGSFRPYLLIDKGLNSCQQRGKMTVLPVWAFLLME